MLKWAKSSTTEMRSQAFLSESWSLDLLLENSSASSHSSHFHWPFPLIPISIRTLRLGGAPPVKMAIWDVSPCFFLTNHDKPKWVKEAPFLTLALLDTWQTWQKISHLLWFFWSQPLVQQPSEVWKLLNDFKPAISLYKQTMSCWWITVTTCHYHHKNWVTGHLSLNCHPQERSLTVHVLQPAHVN